MSYIEFDYQLEDGTELLIEATGNVNYDYISNALDFQQPKYIDNINYKCITEDGCILAKDLISHKDQTMIEEIINYEIQPSIEEHIDFNENYYD